MANPSLLLIMNDLNVNKLQVAYLINNAIDLNKQSTLLKQLSTRITPENALEYANKFITLNISPERELNEYIITIDTTNYTIPKISTFISYLGKNEEVEDVRYSNLNEIKSILVSNLKLIQFVMISAPLNNYTEFIKRINTIDGLGEEIFTDILDPEYYSKIFIEKGIKSETISTFTTDIYNYRSKMKIFDPNFKDPIGTGDEQINKLIRNLNAI